MRNGCCKHADIFILDARHALGMHDKLHPFLSILLCHEHYGSVGGLRWMTSGTGCKGCQNDASLHSQLEIYLQSDWLIFNCSADMSNVSWDTLLEQLSSKDSSQTQAAI